MEPVFALLVETKRAFSPSEFVDHFISAVMTVSSPCIVRSSALQLERKRQVAFIRITVRLESHGSPT